MATPPKPRPPRRWKSLAVGGIAIGLLAALSAFLFAPSWSAGRHRERAEHALNDADLPGAVAELGQCLAADPDDTAARFLLARTLRRSGRFDEAAGQLAEAGRRGWPAEAVRLEAALARVQRRGTRGAEGQALVPLVRDRHPEERAILEAMYRGDLAAGDADRAGYWLHLWLERYPNDWLPRLWQAELLETFHQDDRAQADYRRVLELRPDQPRALLGLGLLAVVNRGDFPEGERCLRRYLELVPGHPAATLGLAQCRHGLGDVAEARRLAEAVLAARPEDGGAALLLGTLALEGGNGEEALRWLRKADGWGADPRATSYQLALALRQTGRPDEAALYERRFETLRETAIARERAAREPKPPR